jgi:hypothetical protein
LDRSTEAKRANRNFRKAALEQVAGAAEVVVEEFGLERRSEVLGGEDQVVESDIAEEDADEVVALVCANILVPLVDDAMVEGGATVASVTTAMAPAKVRAVARRAVFLLLKATKAEMPRVDETIASGYWNVPMDADSIAKTAFTSKFGLYEWMVVPFGLGNAVPAFERLMETVLIDLKWRVCLVYLDDCVVFSKDFPSHLIRLRQVLTRFRKAGHKLKMKKHHWGRSQVAFLGHIVTPSGILPNPEKVKAVMNVQRPRDVHGIRSLLELTSYFRRYIPGYALISAPLERLKTKDAPFQWNKDCENASLQIQHALMKPPILVYPNHSERFKLYVDSSRYAVGACLKQEVDGRDRVVAYASKLLTGSQKNWINKQDGISEIECWGVTGSS